MSNIKDCRSEFYSDIAWEVRSIISKLPGARTWFTRRLKEGHAQAGRDTITSLKSRGFDRRLYELEDAARSEGRQEARENYGARLEDEIRANRNLRAELQRAVESHKRYVEATRGQTEERVTDVYRQLFNGLPVDALIANLDKVPEEALEQELQLRENREIAKWEAEDAEDARRAEEVAYEVESLRRIGRNMRVWVTGKYGKAGLYDTGSSEKSKNRHEREMSRKAYTPLLAEISRTHLAAKRQFIGQTKHGTGGRLERTAKLDMGEGYSPLGNVAQMKSPLRTAAEIAREKSDL